MVLEVSDCRDCADACMKYASVGYIIIIGFVYSPHLNLRVRSVNQVCKVLPKIYELVYVLIDIIIIIT